MLTWLPVWRPMPENDTSVAMVFWFSTQLFFQCLNAPFEAADSTRALNEPCATLPDTLTIKPGERRTLDPITLK